MSPWTKAVLGDLAADVPYGCVGGPFGSELTTKDYIDPPGVPVIRGSNLGAEGFLDDGFAYVSEMKAQSLRANQAFPGDIIFTQRGTIGQVAQIPHHARYKRYVISQSQMKLTPNLSRVEPRFLVQYFRSPTALRFLLQNTLATGVPHINLGILRRALIPLPPLAEQRRIAEILDRADTLRATRRATLDKLDSLARSIFVQMFAKELDGPAVDVATSRKGVPEAWSWKLLTDVARLATGHTPDRERADYWNGGIPWISLTDIRSLDGRIATRTIQNVSALGIENSSAVILPKGTVCFSRTASVGFVTVMGTVMATSQDFVNWVCGPELDPTYLMWALLTARPRLQALSSGSTHKTIYVRVVEQFRALIPPIELQREFARRVATVGRLKSRSGGVLASLDHLFASIQDRAFRAAL